MFQTQALITKKSTLGAGYYELELLAPEIALAAKPGQFVQLKVAGPESYDPLLGRPISLYQINPVSGSITVIFKVVGRGTTLLAGKKVGELIEVIGPIGNGFTIPDATRRLALIAGGIGMPPLFCLAEALRKIKPQLEMAFFYGGRSSRDLLTLDAWETLNIELYLTTDDGSQGDAGLVTELFLRYHQESEYDFLVACGPNAMLKAVKALAARERINGQMSLEAHMACGVGACLGCTCQTKAGNRRVCVDGPVFGLGEVEF